MKFLDTSLRMRHDRIFFNFASQYPDARMALWCMNSNEMFYISAKSAEEIEQIVEEAQTALEADHTFVDGASAVLTLSISSCSDERSIDNVAHQCRCWLIPPIMYAGGWAHYRYTIWSRTPIRC